MAIIYNKVSNFQTKDALYLLDHLTINSKDSVLDLGCGTGRLAAVIADRVGPEGSVIGVDPDQDRIQVAISKGDGRIQFMVGDDTNFPEGQYDVVTCTDVIHWIKDKEAAFKRVYDNLKPGGKFALTALPSEALPPLAHIMFEQIGCLEEALSSINFIPLNRYIELARSVGFEVTLVEKQDRKLSFSIDFFANFFYSVFHARFDLITHPALNELKKQYAEVPVEFTFERLTAILTKPI